MIKRVTSIVLSVLMLASIFTCLPSTYVKANAWTSSQINIVKRADSLYSCTWVAQSDVSGWANGDYAFTAGEEYHLPYAQPITSGEYIGFGVSVIDYLKAANTPDSIFYTTQSDYSWAEYPATSTYYGTDCSAFASYCWGIDRTTTYYLPNKATDYGVISLDNMNTLQLGDALNEQASHVVLVTDLFYDGAGNVTAVEITEQTTPDTQRNVFTPEELITEFEGYSILRYTGTVTAPTFTLSFKANGGSGTMSNQTVVYDDLTTVANSYTRDGSTFVGWAAYRNPIERFYYTNGIESGWYKRGEQPEGWSMTILPADYNFGTIGYGVDDTVTLYALWQDNETGVIEAPGSVGYFPACDSSYLSYYDAMTSIGYGEVCNDWDLHCKIAEANGISDFSGTAEQNITLLNLLKQGLLINPDATSDEDDATYETVTAPTEPSSTEAPSETVEATEATEETIATETASESEETIATSEATESPTASIPEATETEVTEATVPTETITSTNMALGKTVTAGCASVLNTSDVNYNMTAVNKALPMLVDGDKEYVNTWFNNDKGNVAFNKAVLEGPYTLTVDLGQGVLVDNVQLFAHQRKAWNYLITDKVTFSVSTDGTNWKQIGEVEASETTYTNLTDTSYSGDEAIVSIYNFSLNCKPIKARYVRATFPTNSTTNGIVAFNEFEVFGTPTALPVDGGTNLASGRTVTVTYNEEINADDANYNKSAVEKALPQLVDGIKNNYNCWVNNAQPNVALNNAVLTGPYTFTVDLGALSNVSKIALYNYERKGWNRQPVDSVEYSVSADGINWTTLGAVDYEDASYNHIADPGYTGVGADVYINDFALRVEVSNVRYVRASFSTNSEGFVIFNEFEVYGKKMSDTSYEYGDVNGNGLISITDVTFIQKILARVTTGNANHIKYGDVNLDGKLSIRDVTYIQMFIVKLIDAVPVIPKSKILDIPVINQNPELPTGCEITSVTQMLRYVGCNVEKTALAKEMPYHDWDPEQGYVGNPFTSNGYTIFPPALLSLVKKYAGSSVDMSGCTIEDLKRQIAIGKPVVVWVKNFRGWNLHCILAVGYDENYIYLNDCSRVSRDTYTFDAFATYWAGYGNRALSY